MPYEISYVPSAAKAIRKLDKQTAIKVVNAISELANNPRPNGCIQLRGGNGEYRIRVGSYRIIYDIHDQELIILVLRVGHRREIYR
ncbi:type II toxin-antitoxin system RelE/ParE family toxin [Corynebacterium felinum]|uniref:mRNA interferase RelE/StbE n=1 Tax=Corynebacterium felinum TaxID=131318 RepID=A0ABU2BA90_9CORY|nr:type II toxin-antitoxin system RelE/ParE family toxin [Corynebacterium felinum]MDF5820710.1 type II toxin-antitoxin system RelE/ParE family toxin [Corynebacterium felinum]MDR7355515.1 mRNA interferase RelE/StbE [Corynebacterium felinum]WJY94865.1 Toxin RelG [Corynebacterium felinum]